MENFDAFPVDHKNNKNTVHLNVRSPLYGTVH